MAPDIARLLDEVKRFCAGATPTTGPELAARTIHTRHAIDLLEVRFSRDAAAFAATDEHDEQGAVSPIEWIRLSCNMGGGAAGDRVAVGQQIAEMPETVAAIETGDIGFPHMALIARTATAIALSGTNVPFDEAPLLTKAREFSVGRFRNFCDQARHAGDPEGYVDEEIDGVEARSLVFTTGEGGRVWIRGMLDSEGGAAVRTALEPLARKMGRDDRRRRDRRLGDALVEASHALLDRGNLPVRGGQRPHLQVTTTLDALLARAGAPASDLEFSPLPISAKAVERLACDCNVTRILLGADSMVIDVGRSKRVVSPPQRRAL